MAMAQNVHIQARKPAIKPHVKSVLASFKYIARLSLINREKMSVKPNILPLLPRLISSSLRLLSLIQALPNNPGEYHIPPTATAERPATSTASQLIVPMYIIV